jgi:hypothetical protein
MMLNHFRDYMIGKGKHRRDNNLILLDAKILGDWLNELRLSCRMTNFN